MKKNLGLLLVGWMMVGMVMAQQPEAVSPTMESRVAATPVQAWVASFDQQQSKPSLLSQVPFKNVGPTVMSGRVVDLDVDPRDPTHFYVAYASGGLWKTTNNGISFEPLFDHEATLIQGDIAIDWTHGETIWVGTGENNSSRSSYAGTGMYKSIDQGKTWQHLGLEGTQRIGRIVLHPSDPNTVWVAALGPLYSASPERGVYKTSDGGTTWQKTLFVDDNTGAIDLVVDPARPEVLYAATWHRQRRAWNFVESGSGSGIYKSTDGGETWQRLTGPGSGFPQGAGVGRIGLALYAGNTDLLYAIVDNQDRRPKEVKEEEGLTRDALRTISEEAFLQLKKEDLEAFLRDNDFPEKYTAEVILKQVKAGEIEPIALVWYLEDANSELYDTPVVGAEVYRSEDGGASWQRTHQGFIDDLFFSYGYYFGQIRVADYDSDKLYLLGVPILRSDDGGKTFVSIHESNVHVDHHALWVHPSYRGHLINGNDGGVNISYDDGKTWFKANTPAVGQFYAIAVDEAKPYRVYGGLQDNGVWVGPSSYEPSYRWYGNGDYPYDSLLGGDGMQVEVDTRTNDLVYTGFQFGYYSRVNQRSGERKSIKPQHALGERPLRFNWQAPIHLSRHQADIVYFGTHKFHRSLNRGDDWETLSDDLTKGGRPGDVPYGSLTTIDESPLKFGLLYVGSDDGLVHRSTDGGYTWTRISDTLPQDLWVTRVEASSHQEGRVYVTLNGYRWDHFAPYLFRSEDYGQTWHNLSGDLPMEPVNVVVEDPANADILYVGTDQDVYVTLDGGVSFMKAGKDLPRVPVHDLKVQAREKDLVVGTHGRSLFIADIEHIQQLTPELLAKTLHLFEIAATTHRTNWGRISASWREPTTPEVTLPLYAGAEGEVAFTIKTSDGQLLKRFQSTVAKGLNYPTYDLSIDPENIEALNKQRQKTDKNVKPLKAADNGIYYLPPETYTVEATLDAHTVTGELKVKEPNR